MSSILRTQTRAAGRWTRKTDEEKRAHGTLPPRRKRSGKRYAVPRRMGISTAPASYAAPPQAAKPSKLANFGKRILSALRFGRGR